MKLDHVAESSLTAPGAANLQLPPVERSRGALRRLIYDMVALVFQVEADHLEGPTRGRKRTAHARQVAMYLAHVAGGLSLSEVGRLFERDRTTVAHACAVIEDARDDDMFDRMLDHLERAVAQQVSLVRFSRQEVLHEQ